MRHISLGLLVYCSVLSSGCNLRHGADRDAGPEVDSGGLECGGPSGLACGEGLFCDALTCGGFGRCQPAPTVCGRVYDPVCGCDGRDYSSPCDAHQRGVVIASRGECGMAAVCGTRGSPPCPLDTYCRFDETCGASDRGGICQPFPSACDSVEDPVCGCDGSTYSNACLAAAAGVSVARRGVCEASGCAPQDVRFSPGCDERMITWDGWLCREETGCCEGADCGSSYSSLVECRRAHQSCDRQCRGWAGPTCLPEEFCDFDGPGCDFSDASGICRLRPTSCEDPVARPVCGCDFVSYPDECSAHMAGTDVAIEGGCMVPG